MISSDCVTCGWAAGSTTSDSATGKAGANACSAEAAGLDAALDASDCCITGPGARSSGVVWGVAEASDRLMTIGGREPPAGAGGSGQKFQTTNTRPCNAVTMRADVIQR